MVSRVHVVHVDMQVCRNRRPILSSVADHHDGIPDPHFSVHDRAVRHIIAPQFTSPECLLKEVDDLLVRQWQSGRVRWWSSLPA